MVEQEGIEPSIYRWWTLESERGCYFVGMNMLLA